jgi:hypothetical protein
MTHDYNKKTPSKKQLMFQVILWLVDNDIQDALDTQDTESS